MMVNNLGAVHDRVVPSNCLQNRAKQLILANFWISVLLPGKDISPACLQECGN